MNYVLHPQTKIIQCTPLVFFIHRTHCTPEGTASENKYASKIEIVSQSTFLTVNEGMFIFT